MVWREGGNLKLNYFILSYNKPDKIPTLEMLHNYGIYDDVYVVVGYDDPSIEEYRKLDNSLIFDKYLVADKVDSIGTYAKTLKLCTYARVFVDEYAKKHDMKYICVLFDDIMSVEIRYRDGDCIRSSRDFDLHKALSYYAELLELNEHIYMTGPPGSSFYIGSKPGRENETCSHYANILIYDVTKPLAQYKASVMEDMYIVLSNSVIGHIGLFPFGLQVNCRPSKVTNEAYKGVSNSEYIQQYAILSGTVSANADNMIVPYYRYVPRIIGGRYKK